MIVFYQNKLILAKKQESMKTSTPEIDLDEFPNPPSLTDSGHLKGSSTQSAISACQVRSLGLNLFQRLRENCI